MDDLRNRWAYAILAALVAAFCAFIFYTISLKTYRLDSLLHWGGTAMGLSAGLAILMWPRSGEASLSRVLGMGFIIPTIVMFILALIFSILNPGFPDATRDGIETNLNHIVQGGILVFFVFSFMTFGVPYILGIVLSIPFANPDRD